MFVFIPLLYIASLGSLFVTFLCWLWSRHPFTEEECQRVVYKHLCVIRGIHLLNHLFYGLVLGNYLVDQTQSIPWTLLSCSPIGVIFTIFWIFLNAKIKLVKGRLNTSS